jgi:subtilisin family serine protease
VKHGGGTRRRGLVLLVLCALTGGAWARTSVDGQIMVLLRDGDTAPAATTAALARDYGLRPLEHHRLATLEVESALFALADAGKREALLARLAKDARVASAQPVRLHHVAGMPPKDPYFDLQVRTRPGGVTSLATRGSGRNVRIAIIDTGIDTAHPDLLGQITEARNFVGGDSHIIPAEFHGTAVTGLIAAHAGNGIGIHGLAPNATVYVLRACWEPSYGDGVCSSYTLAQALDYAIEIRARIINLSLAGPDDPLLVHLVERATELGAMVFGAIGEEPGQSFPTSIPSVIAVEQARQSGVEVPGERLTVPGLQLLTTVPGGRYDFVSGPSFATAHASGVAAIMLELQPRLGPHELAAWLRRLHENPEPH